MKKWISLTIFLLLIIQLVMIAPLLSQESSCQMLTADDDYGADIATWSIGDQWVYVGEANGEGDDFSFNGEVPDLTYKVIDKTTIDQHGTTYDAYKVELTGSLTGEFDSENISGDIEGDLTGITYYRIYDLAEIYADYSFIGIIRPLSLPIDLDCEFTTIQKYVPPVENYNFIIRQDWESEIHSKVFSEGSFYLEEFYDEDYEEVYWNNFTTECTRVKSINVPAGYFKCYGLSTSSININYYSEEVGNLVKGEIDYSDDNSSFQVNTELHSFSRIKQPIILTAEILPSPFPVPGDEISITGTAYYSASNNPVKNEQVTIRIPATDQQWSTSTDRQGFFQQTITAPLIQDNSACDEEFGSDGVYITCSSGSDEGYKVITLVSVENKVPTQPEDITAEEYIFTNTTYEYETVSTDLNGDDLFYQFTFDANTTDWLGPYSSGEVVSVNYTWFSTGTYNVSAIAKDERGSLSERSDNHTVHIAPPFIIDTGGPYQQEPMKTVQFNGTASGGFPPYQITWFFGDGTNSTNLSTSHVYNESGVYDATLRITDSASFIREETTTVSIFYDDSTPPEITIIKPEKGLYLNNERVLPLPFTIIIGAIDIQISVIDEETAVTNVSLSIDGTHQCYFDSPPYNFTYDDRSFGRNTISIKATNIARLSSTSEIQLWKFF